MGKHEDAIQEFEAAEERGVEKSLGKSRLEQPKTPRIPKRKRNKWSYVLISNLNSYSRSACPALFLYFLCGSSA
jgi:hypothetical protein